MSVIVTLPGSRQQINAWHKEWHVMKEHSSEFCGTGSRGGGKMVAKPEPIDWSDMSKVTPRVRRQPNEESHEARTYLAACRELKKTSDANFSRLGAHFMSPHSFHPYAQFLSAVVSDASSAKANPWASLCTWFAPSAEAFVAKLMTIDLNNLPRHVAAALSKLPRTVDADQLAMASPAAAALAKWCLSLRAYASHLKNTGSRAVSPGITSRQRQFYTDEPDPAAARLSLRGRDARPASSGGTPRAATCQRRSQSRGRKLSRTPKRLVHSERIVPATPPRALRSSPAPVGPDNLPMPPAVLPGTSTMPLLSVPLDLHRRPIHSPPVFSPSIQRTLTHPVQSYSNQFFPPAPLPMPASLPRAMPAPLPVHPAATLSGVSSLPPTAPRGLSGWLQSLGLEAYAQILAANEVDAETLPLLTERDLDEMGISLPAKKSILESISRLRAKEGRLNGIHG
ncbi:hypothetical protein DIPPA_11392 [Diplonema papillatum]|nr:hypothetical protein DIPPA_11392 [Diplonema papillatum]